jgi:hypothetical protein
MKKVLFVIVAIIVAQTFTSCRKKKDTIAHIYVRDETDNAVNDATVILYGTSTGDPIGGDGPGFGNFKDTVQTSSSGLAVFNLSDIYQSGQAGVAILDIKAYKLNRLGTGLIKIEPEIISEQSIIIQP